MCLLFTKKICFKFLPCQFYSFISGFVAHTGMYYNENSAVIIKLWKQASSCDKSSLSREGIISTGNEISNKKGKDFTIFFSEFSDIFQNKWKNKTTKTVILENYEVHCQYYMSSPKVVFWFVLCVSCAMNVYSKKYVNQWHSLVYSVQWRGPDGGVWWRRSWLSQHDYKVSDIRMTVSVLLLFYYQTWNLIPKISLSAVPSFHISVNDQFCCSTLLCMHYSFFHHFLNSTVLWIYTSVIPESWHFTVL